VKLSVDPMWVNRKSLIFSIFEVAFAYGRQLKRKYTIESLLISRVVRSFMPS
jgi:hypothetical protein